MNWTRTLATPLPALVGTPSFESEHPNFAPVASEIFDQLRDLPERYEVSAGTRILSQGTVPSSVTLVCGGLVRLGHVDTHGTEITLGLRAKGWYAGATSALLNTPSLYSVTCLQACTLASIPAAEFMQRLLQNTRMLRHFVLTLSGELASQSGAQVHLMTSSAEDRLTCFLREREATNPRWKTVDPLPALKQMELAQLLAIKPETLSRILNRRNRGVAQKNGTDRKGTPVPAKLAG